MSSLMFVRPAVSEELRHTDRFAVRLAGCADVARRAVISNVGVKNIPSAGQAGFTYRAPV